MSNQVYTFQQLQNAVTHVLAGAPDATLNPAPVIVNAALNWVVCQRPWTWRQKPISFQVAQTAFQSLVRGSDGLTVTAQSNGHGLVSGLAFQVLGTTQGIVGDVPFDGSFTVATVIDANNFTYQQPGDANDTASVPGFWIGGQQALPSDFGSMYVLKSATNSFRDVMPTTLSDLLERRQFAYGSTYELYWAVTWIPQSVTTAEPTPMLAFFPTPTATLLQFLQGIYLRRIPMLVSSSDIPDVPSPYHDLVYHACRAFAKSREEDMASEDWRITMMLLEQLGEEDGAIQSTAGKMRSTLHPRTFPVSQFYPNGRITA